MYCKESWVHNNILLRNDRTTVIITYTPAHSFFFFNPHGVNVFDGYEKDKPLCFVRSLTPSVFELYNTPSAVV